MTPEQHDAHVLERFAHDNAQAFRKVEITIAPMHGAIDPPPIAITIRNGFRSMIRVELRPEDFALAITGRMVVGQITRGGLKS